MVVLFGGKMIMDEFTIPCSPEQAHKALALGAPLETSTNGNHFINVGIFNSRGQLVSCSYAIPTAEQMLGWLRQEHNIHVRIDCEGLENYVVQLQSINSRKDINIENPTYKGIIGHKGYPSAPEAVLAAIDAALEYLSNKKE